MKQSLYIQQLKAFYRQYKRSPTKREFKNYTAMSNAFGSWNNALKAAGLPVRSKDIPSQEALISSLQAFYKKNKKSPRAGDCRRKNGLFDTKTYLKGLDVPDWASVLKLAGLNPYFEVSPFTRDKQKAFDLVVDFVRINNIQSADEYRLLKGELPSSDFIVMNFGWNNVMVAAGLKEHLTKENILEKVYDFLSEHDRPPTLSECAHLLKCSTRAITSVVGRYNSFIFNFGMLPANNSPSQDQYTKDQLKKLYIDFSVKNNLVNGATITELKNAEDIPSPDVFINRYGSINNLRIACGYKPVRRAPKKYNEELLIKLLKKECEVAGRKLTHEEIQKNDNLPSISTFLRVFKTTSFKEIWKKL